MKRILCIGIICTVFLLGGYSREWSQFGDIELTTSFSHAESAVSDPASEWFGLTDWMTALGAIEMEHRLEYGQVMFRLHHRLDVNADAEFAYNLYEAYVSLYPAEWITADIGKKHVNWGMGSLFLPTDVLNPRVIDTTDARQDIGFPGISITLTPNENVSVISALSFENAVDNLDSEYWQDFRYGLLLSLFFGNLQLKTSFVYEPDTVFRPGLAASFDIEGFVFSVETAVDFHNRTFYPQSAAIWEQAELWNPYFYADAGVRKLLSFDDFSISISAEYFYTNAGFTGTQETYFFSNPLYFPQHLGQHYIYANIGLETANVMMTNHSIIANLQDGSMLFWHSVSLILIENLDLNINVMWTTGTSAHEFGLMPERIKIAAGAVFHF